MEEIFEPHHTPGSWSVTLAAQNNISRLPFDLAVTFWGELFSGYFLDLCLRSLLSPGNLPELLEHDSVRLLICTTVSDFERVKRSTVFEYANRYFTEVKLVEMQPPVADADRYRVMSSGHKRLIQEMYDKGSIGIMLAPDMVCADGYVARIKEHVIAGRELVLAAALRFDLDKVNNGLSDGKHITADDLAITTAPKDLVKISLASLHPEVEAFDWDAAAFSQYPISVFLMAPGQGIVLHTLSWAAVMVDYRAFDSIDLSSLDMRTIDDDFIERNIHNIKSLFVERDSDKIFFATLTPRSELYGERGTPWFETFDRVKHWSRIKAVRHVLYDYLSDATKRSLYLEPVFVHFGEVNDEWQQTVDRAAEIVEKAVGHEPSEMEKRGLRLHAKVREGVLRHVRFWFHKRLQS